LPHLLGKLGSLLHVTQPEFDSDRRRFGRSPQVARLNVQGEGGPRADQGAWRTHARRITAIPDSRGTGNCVVSPVPGQSIQYLERLHVVTAVFSKSPGDQATPPSLLGFKRFASAAWFCHAHDEVGNFRCFQPIGLRPAPLAWQRRMRHQQFAFISGVEEVTVANLIAEMGVNM
jgi:hypothetical protein